MMADLHRILDYAMQATVVGLGVVIMIWGINFLPDSIIKKYDEKPGHNIRYASLDGLRCFLSLWVVITHVWSYYDKYYRGLIWDWPNNPYFNQCGNIAVPMFLMITGFLFWSKAIRSKGLLNPIKLYINRAKRILPLYYFLCTVVVLSSLYLSKLPWIDIKSSLWGEVISLIIPGKYFVGSIAGVERFFFITPTWTLYFEIIFYLVLPLIGLFAFKRITAYPFLLLSFFGLRWGWAQEHPFFYLAFLMGAVVAEITESGLINLVYFKGKQFDYVIVISVFIIPIISRGQLNYVSFLAACFCFFIIVCGNNCFGILTEAGTRVIGTISYSVYIVHMPIVFFSLMILNKYYLLTSISNIQYAFVNIIILFLCISVSLSTYLVIEKPAMSYSRPKLRNS